jgi:hypothetical protein
LLTTGDDEVVDPEWVEVNPLIATSDNGEVEEVPCTAAL